MFDVSNLSARDQFEAAVAVSGMCLVAAVLLREWFTDREIRIMARILGAAGWAVVVTFAWRMTETNETLASQILVQKGTQDATQIADPTRYVVVAAEFSHAADGSTVSITKYSDGRYSPLSVAPRCVGGQSGYCQWNPEQLANGNAGRSGFGARPDDVRNAASGMKF